MLEHGFLFLVRMKDIVYHKLTKVDLWNICLYTDCSWPKCLQ
ncbi:hypothetical protein XNC1_2425 [Xenorhabdus nematophila ATCC 19061]|uniref:Uncharacterized protein n=1 Tax=Xenorhabdus nematophila (strain ATCC 19061 / DSM 3370 / CCUG 14189 / LMG 1036 / NCIMB 9965 / AN6) TaxID=406817 RepID=D3VGP8_XENNA|nr:hypothetical protein XNC1_2425 [Xenorhabdus nematophila ATCC 19061]